MTVQKKIYSLRVFEDTRWRDENAGSNNCSNDDSNAIQQSDFPFENHSLLDRFRCVWAIQFIIGWDRFVGAIIQHSSLVTIFTVFLTWHDWFNIVVEKWFHMNIILNY